MNLKKILTVSFAGTLLAGMSTVSAFANTGTMVLESDSWWNQVQTFEFSGYDSTQYKVSAVNSISADKDFKIVIDNDWDNKIDVAAGVTYDLTGHTLSAIVDCTGPGVSMTVTADYSVLPFATEDMWEVKGNTMYLATANWWIQGSVSAGTVIGSVAVEDIESITFTGDKAFQLDYYSVETEENTTISGATTYTISDMATDDNANFSIGISDNTLTKFGVTWTVNQHDWADATCTSPMTCKNEGCTATKGEAKGHGTGIEDDTYKAATCTEDGKEANIICPDCKDILTEGADIPATGHADGVNDEKTYKAATCTETGKEANIICPTCKVILTEGKTIDMIAHDYDPDTHKCKLCEKLDPSVCLHPADKNVTKDDKEATCTEKGYTGDVVCDDCNEVLEKGKDIDPKGHTAKDGLQNEKDATCTEKGYTGDVVCSVCEEIITKGSDVDALGHKDEDLDGKCDVCSADMTVNYEIIAGGDSEWTKGSETGLTISSDADFSLFVGVELDGKALEASQFTAKAGSTVVEIKAEVLESLEAGEHEFKIVSKNGSAITKINVKAAEKEPEKEPANSADASPMAALAIMAMLAFAVAFVAKKRA